MCARIVAAWLWKVPHLLQVDFFLWGHLKDRVFKTSPNNLDELKKKIVEEIKIIPLKKLFQNMVHRTEVFRENGGGHFENLM